MHVRRAAWLMDMQGLQRLGETDIEKDKGCGERIGCQEAGSRADQWYRWRTKQTEYPGHGHEMTMDMR